MPAIQSQQSVYFQPLIKILLAWMIFSGTVFRQHPEIFTAQENFSALLFELGLAACARPVRADRPLQLMLGRNVLWCYGPTGHTGGHTVYLAQLSCCAVAFPGAWGRSLWISSAGRGASAVFLHTAALRNFVPPRRI